MKRNFDSRIRRQCIQDDSTKYRYFHKNKSLREKIAIPPHSVRIKHLSKSGKLNEVGKVFPDLFYLNKYTLTTTISYMIDNIEASQFFQTNGSKMMGISYCSKHSINYFLPNMQKTIVKHNKDWHDRVTYQNSLGIFSFSLVPDKKLSFSSNIYLLSLLLDQLSLG